MDVRTFCEYNACHVAAAVSVWTSKIRKKKLQQGVARVTDYLEGAVGGSVALGGVTVVSRTHYLPLTYTKKTTNNVRSTEKAGRLPQVVYDQSSSLPPAPDTFLKVVLERLSAVCQRVCLLKG